MRAHPREIMAVVLSRHCKERSDEAIHIPSPWLWIASLRSQ
jgi:hypothetical protein